MATPCPSTTSPRAVAPSCSAPRIRRARSLAVTFRASADLSGQCGLNFGVLLAWVVVAVGLMIAFTVLTHKLDLRKHNRQIAKQRQEKEV